MKLAALSLFPGFLLAPCLSVAAPMETAATALHVESRTNPTGLDELHPALSWMMTSERRGEVQTAYQVLVASTPELLASDKGDLWDSGKFASAETTHVEYAGQTLTTRERCFWKVRIWDRDGKPSAWSQPAVWTMGLLNPADWKAQWISDPILADPANRPLSPIHCYRSELTTKSDATKWIVFDLGAPKHLDSVNLMPARPQGQNPDFRTPLFPVRFKVETADNREFTGATTVVDQTGSDYPSPRNNGCGFPFAGVTARYVRLTVTKLPCWDGQDYGFALGGMAVSDGPQVISSGVAVECSDSVESDKWSKKYLGAGNSAVGIAPDSPALATAMPDATAKFTVSRVPMLRRDFDVAGKVKRATLSVTARGFYEVRINGQKVGNEFLAPGYTDTTARIQYQTHDVTSLMRSGKNAIGALLGYGWHAGHMNLAELRCMYGYFPQFMAQLDVELTDGTMMTLGTDGQWRSTLEGPVRWSDLLDGEGYDTRREMSGWDQPGFDAKSWQTVWSRPRDATPLVWQRSQPVKEIREMQPASMKEVKPGVFVYDMGQEITGWCRLKLDGPAGTHVRLRHAELVSADGNIDVRNLWGTPQQDDYILDGHGFRTVEPHFTYHGFRYVELTGLPGKPRPDTLVAVNLRTSAATAGHFECSNPLYNRINTAAAWTQANLIFDVPTGCAARSERLSWTGDIRPCVQSLLFNFDVAPLLGKYSADLRDDQTPDGRFTDICPHSHLMDTTICVGSPGWADAGVSLPWELYVNTGDRRLLAKHYDAARRWVDAIHASNPNYLWLQNRGQNWGDWMSAGAATPKELGSTAFFAHSADLVSRMASVLGRKEEAEKYAEIFQNIRRAFVKSFVSPDGIIGGSAPAQSILRDVTAAVRGQIKNGKLSFAVKNDVLGGDPALGKLKKLHIVLSGEKDGADHVYTEDSMVDLSGKNGRPMEVVWASYGFDGSDRGDVQGNYALALQFGLLDEPVRTLAAKRMDQLVINNGHHPTTGFWTSVELMLSLSSMGYQTDAAEMLNQHEMPSWGYMAETSTTFWEAFDPRRDNLSLNHWTHSAISEWLWREIAGLNPDEQHPGYETFTIRPRPTKEVTSCNASYDSIRGPIATRWLTQGDKFMLSVTVPANTTATIYIPASGSAVVMESDKPVTQAVGVSQVRTEPGVVICQVGSGAYQFTSRMAK